MSSSEMTVEDFIRANTKCEASVFLTMMISFGFSYEDRQKNVNILSPGEITRLYLLICSLNAINVMVLDEPTNYLDVEALDALEEIVTSFDGTILASSHDRYFIEKFNPSFTLEFKEGQMKKVLH